MCEPSTWGAFRFSCCHLTLLAVSGPVWRYSAGRVDGWRRRTWRGRTPGLIIVYMKRDRFGAGNRCIVDTRHHSEGARHDQAHDRYVEKMFRHSVAMLIHYWMLTRECPVIQEVRLTAVGRSVLLPRWPLFMSIALIFDLYACRGRVARRSEG